MPASRRNAIDKALVEGRTYSWIATKFSKPDLTVSRTTIFRHSKHALKPADGKRLHTTSRVAAARAAPTPGPEPSAPATSLLERVESLLAESKSIAAEAKSQSQWASAVSALREVRCCIELLGKLSGELSSANINFFAIDLTQERVLEFLLAAEQRGPHIIEYMKKQFGTRFGVVPPNMIIEFIEAPTLQPNPDGRPIVTITPPAPPEAE